MATVESFTTERILELLADQLAEIAADYASSDEPIAVAETTNRIAAIAAVNAVIAAQVVSEKATTGLRNRIVNGDFRVNQRAYVSAVTAGVGVYTFDRWKSTIAGTTLTFTASPAGQLLTINSTGQIAQVIERANMPAGRYVLSHGGTAQARCYNLAAGPPAFADAPLIVDIDGTTDVVVEFVANGGSTKTVGLVQLEAIDAAGVVSDKTLFERRPMSDELVRCQRYYSRFAIASGSPVGSGACSSTTAAYIFIPYKNSMRITPTGSISAVGHVSVLNAAGSAQTCTVVTFGASGTATGIRCDATVASGLAAGNGAILHGIATGWIALDSEFV